MASRPAKKRRIIVPGIENPKDGHVRASHSLSLTEGAAQGNQIGEEKLNAIVRLASKMDPKKRSGPKGLNENRLAMAETSSKSNLFNLQVHELLTAIRPNYEKLKAKTDESLRRLKGLIEGIPERAPLPVVEAERNLWKSSKITIPFPEPRPGKESKFTLAYVKPSNINVVGSFALELGAKSKDPVCIDIAITIPKDIFQEKDYLNYRYFHKRAYYIACIAAGISDVKVPFQTRFAYQNDSPLQPILIVQPSQAETDIHAPAQVQIRILVAITQDTFTAEKLLPYKCNIRNQPVLHDPAKPTASYNATIRSEACVSAYLKLIHTASVECEAFTESCLLGRTWLRQRRFETDLSNGGFGPFEWAALCAALLQGGGPSGRPLLSSRYSNYQLFKAMLQCVAGKILGRPFLYHSNDPELPNSSPPIFYDGVRKLNLLYKMTPWSYQRLRDEAHTTLEMLNDSKFDHFDSTFIFVSHEWLLRYDVLLKTRLTARSVSVDDLKTQVYEVVRQSLGNRAKLVSIFSPVKLPWSEKSALTSSGLTVEVTIGIVLDPEHARRAVDHGPPAEDKEASAQFREFWGEKAELRRFKDGSILESLVWSTNIKDGPIIQQIIFYGLERHLGKEIVKQTTIVGDQVDALIPEYTPSVEKNAPFQAYMEAFQHLERQLRDMEGLPLGLKQLSAACPQLRYGSLQVPGSTRLLNPADIVLQLEGSGRWPDDFAAAQQTKMAFLVKIGELLEITIDGLIARVGIENKDENLLNRAFLDITYPEGHVFRLRIHHDREHTYLDRILGDKFASPRLGEEAAHALSVYRKTYIQGTRHTQAVRTLCTRFPSLSPSIRLFKKWCSAHLLTNHLNEELMELFVICVFVRPYPWESPSSTMTGFLRTLHMLSHWDWHREPLIIDAGANLSTEDITEAHTRFEAWRKIDPAMNSVVLFVASNLDPDGVTWTKGKPLKVVAGRLSGLAKAAMKVVTETGLELDLLELFKSGLGGYDFVIHLKERFTTVGGGKGLASSRYKNLQVQDAMVTDQYGHDSARLILEELEQAYGNSIVFFHGGSGGSVIAGLWNPQFKSRPFRLKVTYSSAPLSLSQSKDEEERVVLNKAAILNEIALLGWDMIRKIEIRQLD